MNKVPLRFLWIVIVISIIVALVWYLTRTEPVVVTLYTVERGRVEKTVSNTRVGTVKSCRRSMVAPAIGGEVSRLPIKEGDNVEKGEVLLELWNDDLRARLKLAEAEKVAAESRVQEACYIAAGAERELKRVQRLVKDKLIPQEQVDRAETEYEAKDAACKGARAQSRVNDAQITVTRAALDRTIIKAPFAGVIAEVNAELGEFVTPSPPGIPTLPALDLIDTSCLYVSAPIDEVDAPPIVPGMPACVRLDAFPDRRCNGKVRRIAPYVLDIEKQARTVEVEVELDEPEDLQGLLPGYSADIEIFLQARDDVVRIPTEAVLEGYRVYVYDGQTGYLSERKFEPGIANWNYTEVKSGLKAGDRIVLSVGREGVKPGVRAQPDKAGDAVAGP
ncbi:MAG TPA: efflux RND transporter periplasmic adaptor subunit [Gammaproteobacteria bacterium]|nr:efflux RND transporter periplasmic adaptor subunit [Gammaproteobacteria bacterium]